MATPPNQLNPSDYAPTTWAAYVAAYYAWQRGLSKTPPPDPPKESLLGKAGGAVAPAIAPITDVTGAITGAVNTVVKLVPRVLEAVVGIVLLAIAANAILKQTTGVDVAGTAKRAGKTAAKAAVIA